jgi:hypothetical protein
MDVSIAIFKEISDVIKLGNTDPLWKLFLFMKGGETRRKGMYSIIKLKDTWNAIHDQISI